MAIAWMLDARASETCAVRSVSCPRAFSGVADVGFDAADVGFAGGAGVFAGMRGAGDSGRSGEGSVVCLIILWILSRVRVLVSWEWLCGFWDETAAGLSGGFKVIEAKEGARADSNSLSSRRNIICSRYYRACLHPGGCEAVVYRGGMLACHCGFRVIKRHKQNFWVFLSENPRFKETLRVI